MASIQKRPDGRYRARYRDSGGREHARHFDRKVDAQAWLDTTRADQLAGLYVDPQRGRTRFSTVADLWLETLADRKPKTVAGYESILARHVLPAFGTMPVASIDTTAVRRFVAGMAREGAAHQTTKNALGVVRAVLATAVESRMVAVNPAADVRLSRTKAKTAGSRQQAGRVFLDAGEVRRLAEATPEPYGVLVLFAAYTGLRAGEVAGAQVGDLDLLRRTMTVRRAVVEVHGRLEVGEPKNGATRTVRLPRFLTAALGDHIGRHGLGPGDWLFQSPDGGQLRHSNFYRRTFRPAVARAGLPAALRFHDLRHTCAALLIAQGAHPKAIQEHLGHGSIQITMDVYGHLYESADEALADGLDAAYAAALADSARTERGLAMLPNASQGA